MPRPRRRFECLACATTHVLEVTAKFCPETGTGVTPLFDEVQTATGVTRPRAERRRRTVEATQRARFVDKVAAPAIEQARQSATPNYDRAFTSQPVSAGAAIGMVNAENRMFSRSVAASAFPMMRAAGGPVPQRGSRDG